MPLSLNEIKSRAVAFSKEWEHETNEDAEAKSFWDGFFNIFGISRRRIATFEEAVAREGRGKGFIDLLWKGTLLIEHKSRGKNLERAFTQAKDYFPGLKDHELPRYIIVCDFANFRIYDLDERTDKEFTLDKLVDNLHLFDFLSGYKRHVFKDQAPINIEAAEKMALLHDALKDIGYSGHQLELYLVRLLFCLFADDTNIFEKGIFYELLDSRTTEDGSDLAQWIAQLFEVLNTPQENRLRNLDESLAAFPYVNGRLFEEQLRMAAFDSKMRRILLDCCSLDWSAISPAIFGSLFQGVMDEKARRNLGAHYTSEKNIMKLIKPLFLDELYAEFDKVKSNARQLDAFHIKLSTLRFLDPACGCGNFLIIAYRELRLLEIEVIKAKFKNQMATNVDAYINVNVDQFYGIEYEEFPAQIAQVAMWLIDHQMNIKVSEAFGEYFVRLPLNKSATIVHGNALHIDWQSLLTKDSTVNVYADKANIILAQENTTAYKTVNVYAKEVQFVSKEEAEPISSITFDYILGNPPFLGKQYQSNEQKADMAFIFKGVQGFGVLDYVTAWYLKAALYMHATKSISKTAFVSTNSICQGEQVGILWYELFKKYNCKILFAHRTFKWNNEAKGNAAVHVIIIGFAPFDVGNKQIFTYENISGEPQAIDAKNINPYLVEGADNFVVKRRTPICSVPEMVFGNMPNDGGYFLFNDDEKDAFLKLEPSAKPFFRKFIGSQEFINNINRWCLWLKDANPEQLSKLPEVRKRIDLVRASRLASNRETTRKLAEFPMLFGEIRQPLTDYLVFPEVSSERRRYIPVGFMRKDVITSNKNYTVANATLYHFGILNSTIHMTWVRNVGGRLKSDYQYSTGIVYNNFPWPENPTEKQKESVEKAAQAVLDARAQFPDASLADLYDPNTMPPALVKAHQALDKAVDLCYRPQPFPNETKRIEYLFELYDKYTAGLFVEEKKAKKKKA